MCEENPGGFPGAKESMEAETMVLTTKGTTGTSTIKEKQRFGRLIDYISCWCVCVRCYATFKCQLWKTKLTHWACGKTWPHGGFTTLNGSKWP